MVNVRASSKLTTARNLPPPPAPDSQGGVIHRGVIGGGVVSRPGLDSYADLGETSPGVAGDLRAGRQLGWKLVAGLLVIAAVIVWSALSHNGFVARPAFRAPVSVAASIAR